MAQALSDIDRYIELYEWRARGARDATRGWLAALRRDAIEQLQRTGFPTLQDEDWKYTDTRRIRETPFQPAAYDPGDFTSNKVRELTYDDTGVARLVFVNGYYSHELSDVPALPKGVRAECLASALDTDQDLVREYLGTRARPDRFPFVALNTALFEDGPFIYVPKGVVLETPIHIVYLSNVGGEPAMSQPRGLIVLRENSFATVIESYVATGGVYWTNAVSEVFVGDGAVLDHYKVEQEGLQAYHVATMESWQGAGSTFSNHNISLGGLLVRNDVNAHLGGEGAEATLNGLYMAGGRQHVDNHTRLEHAMPHCPSHELYKGILSGAARGVFSGKIKVLPDAQKTDAKQTNQNLLLSPEAQVNTKPQLEIYADDVRCTHGATIGRLDDDALFYMRARGIGEEEARGLLTYAFASDIIGRIKVGALRERLEETLFALQARRDDAVSFAPAEEPRVEEVP